MSSRSSTRTSIPCAAGVCTNGLTTQMCHWKKVCESSVGSLFSERLGLVGKADVVEFRSDGTLYPVEYKSGPRRESRHDDVQLCAQAMCLEEMLDREVSCGAIYHYASRRRREVAFDEK